MHRLAVVVEDVPLHSILRHESPARGCRRAAGKRDRREAVRREAADEPPEVGRNDAIRGAMCELAEKAPDTLTT